MINDVSPEAVDAIREYFVSEQEALAKRVDESRWRVANFNTYTNGGAAVAVLAYMGSANALGVSIWPLALFLVGLVAGGIEVRAFANIYNELHEELTRRIKYIESGATNLESMIPKAKKAGMGDVHKWASRISQAAFMLGILVGAYLFVRSLI